MENEKEKPEVELLLNYPKSATQEIHISILTYGENKFIDIRTFYKKKGYKKKGDKEFSPGKGACFPHDKKFWRQAVKVIRSQFNEA